VSEELRLSRVELLSYWDRECERIARDAVAHVEDELPTHPLEPMEGYNELSSQVMGLATRLMVVTVRLLIDQAFDSLAERDGPLRDDPA
jgi:hypothetical protein